MLRVQVKWIASRVAVLWQSNVRAGSFSWPQVDRSVFVGDEGATVPFPNTQKMWLVVSVEGAGNRMFGGRSLVSQ
ncbi:hypothetical protein TNCV_2944821 [Trichonephila clavipes]|nr:hypothetical protein TNCV_2944821 [Trichonephila clavipes]